MNEHDIEARMRNEGRMPLAALVHVHEIRAAWPVMADDGVKVTAALADHPPVVPWFGHRFDHPRSRDRHFRRHVAVRQHPMIRCESPNSCHRYPASLASR